MDKETRALVTLSAALAAEDPEAFSAAVDRAIADADPVAVEEALLQSYLFLGYPAALGGLAVWRERSGRPAGDPAPEDWGAWADRGARVCAAVYGGQYERLRANIARYHPDMERWMVVEGYGKVLGRPGLALKTRELCIVAILAVRGARVQLYSHLRGALNVGAEMAEVESALACALDYASEDRARTAWEVWSEVRRRRAGAAALEGRGGNNVR